MGGPNFNATVRGSGSPGMQGTSANGTGVEGRSGFTLTVPNPGTGVAGTSSIGYGVQGISSSSVGVVGTSVNGSGVWGESSGAGNSGVLGTSASYFGVVGRVGGVIPGATFFSGSGVQGTSTSGYGVQGISSSSYGVVGQGDAASGVSGGSQSAAGVQGITKSGVGVQGRRKDKYDPNVPNSVAGFFDGGLVVINGPKNFIIDHPLDPENRYLVHNCVESSEMKNVYDGVAQLDEEGAAWVELPEWFEALNGDFRYQLTAVGGAAPGLHVAEEISENRFKIGGGEGEIKVCWQVTGSRKDPWAAANPFEVEVEKPEEDWGHYLDPSLYDAPEEQRVVIGSQEPPDIDFTRLEEERLRQEVMRQQPPPPPPPQFFPPPPQPSMVPPSFDFVRLEEEHRRQMDQLRWLLEEQRRQLEELRRRVERREEGPPEST